MLNRSILEDGLAQGSLVGIDYHQVQSEFQSSHRKLLWRLGLLQDFLSKEIVDRDPLQLTHSVVFDDHQVIQGIGIDRYRLS